MLADSVLADLAQQGPLREQLVAMAWPSLGIAERLQVIQAIQTEDASRHTQAWLMELALADPAPIVRFWGARYGSFASIKPAENAAGATHLQPSEQDLLHRDKVAADENALVRACLVDIDMGVTEAFSKAPQTARLVALRKAHPHSDTWVVDWLTRAVMARIPTHDLRDCAAEFFGRPDVARELLKDDFDDGPDAHTAGESLRKAWALVRVAETIVGLQLVRVLPLNRGLYTIDAEELMDYPVPILQALILRAAQEPAMAPLIRLLDEQGDALPEVLRKDLGYAHADTDRDADR